ncbi:MAG: DUF2867 domain-containing protein [Gemmatimonadetes bacterium]|jgi:hypothetical protein|nr:DUF2867 domain-containing protein [Gemmatimonadota bacterium]
MERGEGKTGRQLMDSRSTQVACSGADAFAPIRRIGGQTGWYFGNWLWCLRGFIDLIVGGVGISRGRRDPDQLIRGDTVDGWQVEAIEADRLLRLAAEMKLPGKGWLQFEVEEQRNGCTIRQTAIFEPMGLGGVLYWYALYPLHQVLFAGMLRGIVSHIAVAR